MVVDGQQRDTAVYKNTIAALGNRSAGVAHMGDVIALGGARLKVVHANAGSSDPNQNSIVMKLSFGNFTALLDADCDSDCEQSLLSEDISAEVLKVPHHGSAYGSSAGFLQKVSPSLAIIEVGKNDYGHPSNGTLERLAASGARIMRTDLDGTIVLSTDGGVPSVSGGGRADAIANGEEFIYRSQLPDGPWDKTAFFMGPNYYGPSELTAGFAMGALEKYSRPG